MNTKNYEPLVIASIILVIGALCSIVSTIIVIGEPDLNMYFLLFISLISLLFAMYYMLSGFRKQDAKKYKCFLISYAVSLLMSVVANAKISEYYPLVGTLGIIAFTLNFGAVMTLGIAKDLGRKVSMSFTRQCIINVFVILILATLLIPDVLNGKDAIATSYYFGVVRHFVLAFVLYVCTIAKYEDKEARGTR